MSACYDDWSGTPPALGYDLDRARLDRSFSVFAFLLEIDSLKRVLTSPPLVSVVFLVSGFRQAFQRREGSSENTQEQQHQPEALDLP